MRACVCQLSASSKAIGLAARRGLSGSEWYRGIFKVVQVVARSGSWRRARDLLKVGAAEVNRGREMAGEAAVGSA